MSWPETDHATPPAQAQGEEESAGDPGGGNGDTAARGGNTWGTGNCTDNKIIFRKLMVLDAPAEPIICKVS